MKKFLIIYIVTISNLCFAAEIEVNLFNVFYPHLGHSVCRRSAVNILWNYELSKDQKIIEWRKHKQICSQGGSYQLILSDIYTSYGDYKDAEKLLKTSIQSVKFDTRYHKSLLHEVYLNLNKFDEALNLARSIIKDYPDFYGGYLSLAANFFVKKNWLLMQQYAEKALSLNDQDPGVYICLVITAYELREDDKARFYYHRAMSLDPSKIICNEECTLRMADIYIQEKDFKEAKNLLNYLLELNPSVSGDKRFVKLQKQCEDADTDLKLD